eukprot:261400-Rhodomonas_salina.1
MLGRVHSTVTRSQHSRHRFRARGASVSTHKPRLSKTTRASTTAGARSKSGHGAQTSQMWRWMPRRRQAGVMKRRFRFTSR